MKALTRGGDTDAYSTTSVASKTSERRKTPRFSLRRIFFRRSKSGAYTSAKTKLNATESSSDSQSESTSSVGQSNDSKDNVAVATATAADVGISTSITSLALIRAEVCSSPIGSSVSSPSPLIVECPLCLQELPVGNFVAVQTCHHRSCVDCLRQYLKIEITESRINIACPECAERYHPNDIRTILDDPALMDKYEEFMLRRVLVSDTDTRWCPAPDCGYAVIASGCASCPKLRCERPGCNTYFCYHCKQHWHPNQTCDAARAERSPNLRSASVTYSHDSASQSEIKPCPRCSAYIIKMDDGSCNHMTCAVCGAEFCWLCMKEISDLHYLSPSGCTFWGKKPWSRKKKILWQLGTLVGAPVGIGLVAGIAVPAMIIGIPVWVGRKLHTRYGHLPQHKRNMVIAGGVTASVIVAPVVASLAVGIGVPILLAYVYGVVPISLCRSGGCGVSTTDSGGVRFEFEENEGSGPSGPYAPDSHSIETTSHRVANPSIGPSIGEMSMAMTGSLSASGSHIDRVGIIRDESDRESASNRAIAGSSLNGSLSGSAVAGPSGFQNRLEVHADVMSTSALTKRSSFSSESANFSLSDKSGILYSSTTTPGAEDSSVKALNGSIRDASISPLEVHVDVYHNNRARNHSGGSNNADASATTQARGPASNHGSPMSNRSVSFCSDGGIGGATGSGGGLAKSKRNRNRSRSFGDKIHEDVETTTATAAASAVPDSLSMHSFIEDDSYRYIGGAALSSSGGGGGDQNIWINSTSEKTALNLTEVENDCPIIVSQTALLKHRNTTSMVTEKSDRFKLFKKSPVGGAAAAAVSGGRNSSSEELELGFITPRASNPSNQRRKSCELALVEGRLYLDSDSDVV